MPLLLLFGKTVARAYLNDAWSYYFSCPSTLHMSLEIIELGFQNIIETLVVIIVIRMDNGFGYPTCKIQLDRIFVVTVTLWADNEITITVCRVCSFKRKCPAHYCRILSWSDIYMTVQNLSKFSFVIKSFKAFSGDTWFLLSVRMSPTCSAEDLFAGYAC